MRAICMVGALAIVATACFVDEPSGGGSTTSKTTGETSSSSTTSTTTASTTLDTTSGTSTTATTLETSGSTGSPSAVARRIDLDLPGNLPDSGVVLDVPVLVRLVEPARVDYALAGDDASNLRFVTSLDGATEGLPYEVDRWDPTGASFVWVLLPEVDPASPAPFYMIYGDNEIPQIAQPAEVWGAGFVGVWHFGGDVGSTAATFASSAPNELVGMNDTEEPGPTQAGNIGTAVFLSQEARIDVPYDTSFNLGGALTLEAWIRPNGASALANDRTPLNRSGSYRLASTRANTGGAAIEVVSGVDYSAGGATLNAGNWYYLAGTLDSGSLALYLDGAFVSEETGVPASLSNGNDMLFGQFFDGHIDELRVSSVSRSPVWFALQYASTNDDLLTVGDAEPFP